MSHPADHAHDHGSGTADHSGPTADVSVRPARPADADAVGDVQAVLWREAYADVLPDDVLTQVTPEVFAGSWRESLEQPPSDAYRLLVASSSASVVGFVAVGPSSDPDAQDVDGELLVGGVRPADRRAGHGSRLLNAAADLAREAGFLRFRAWLLEGDEGTRAFLTGAGFVLDGARRTREVGPEPADVASEVRLSADFPE